MAGTVLLFATWISSSNETSEIFLYVAGITTTGAGIYIWIRRGIKMFYKKKQAEHSIEILEQELAKQKAENQRLTEQNNTLRAANHKIQHRLATLERAAILNSNNSMEISEELAITLEDIKRISKDYHTDIGQLKGKSILPQTKIKMLDSLFESFASQFDSNNIDFKLKVNGSIPYMTENIISQSKLETMIGDHLQNALIAVNASDNSFRGVWAIIGLSEDCYEFSVYDSGIPFEVDTLARLGTERATTHLNTGGSGIGFMTTFETMQECGASLIINEKSPSNSDYTKSVSIRFDGKARYIIETYRTNDFPVSDRYTVIEQK